MPKREVWKNTNSFKKVAANVYVMYRKFHSAFSLNLHVFGVRLFAKAKMDSFRNHLFGIRAYFT